MVTLALTLTDEQAQAVTAQNQGAYPTDVEYLRAYLAPILKGWIVQMNQQAVAAQVKAFQSAAPTATKAEILAAMTGKAP